MLYINGDFGSPNTDSQGYSPRVPAEQNVNAKRANPLPTPSLVTRAPQALAQGYSLAAMKPSALILNDTLD